MASFDIIDASGFGYRLAWRERHYLVRLAAVPLLVKFVCHISVVLLEWDSQFMRQALVMLPSYFADGWMLAHLVRLIFLGQRWPFRPSGDPGADMSALQDRARGIMAGILSYVVIKFIIAGIADVVYQGGAAARELGTPPEPSAIGAVAGILILAGAVWMFRFLWFYIPAALNYPLPSYTRDIKGFDTSFYMLGVWLACCFPVLAFFGIVLAGILMPFDNGGLLSPPVGIEILGAMIRVFADTAIIIISTGGMAHGLYAIAGKRKQR